jgi:hypothetical protein
MRPWAVLLLGASLAALGGVASGQAATTTTTPAPSPGDSPTGSSSSSSGNFSIVPFIPDVDTMDSVFSTDVRDEVPEDGYNNEVIRFQWDLWFNSSLAAPYLVCTNQAWVSVRSILQDFQERYTMPFYTGNNITCLVIFDLATHIQNVTRLNPQILYAAPIPAGFKVSWILSCLVVDACLNMLYGIKLLCMLPSPLQGFKVRSGPMMPL